MEFTNTKENGLEALIVRWLVEQNGYEQGTNADYNRGYAVDETQIRPLRISILQTAKIYSNATRKVPGWRSAIGSYCKCNRCAV